MRFTVAPDHPALPGHFPGRPIVPGVLLLDQVMRAIAAREPEAPPPSRVLRAKFAAPVLPGVEVSIELGPRQSGRIAFLCRAEGIIVLRGEFACPTAPAS